MEAIDGESNTAGQVLVLGSVGVRAGGKIVSPGTGVAARLLAVLAMEFGESVPDGALFERIWAEDPDQGGSKLGVAVYRLRAWLRNMAGSAVRIRRTVDGYVLDGGRDAVDAAQFQRLLLAARHGDRDRRAAFLAEALGLWRGPLPEVTRPATAAALERARREATVEYARLLLSGQPKAALAAVEELADEHPLDEDLQAARIEALVRSGRRPEALAAYHKLRRRLRDELGVNPAARVQQAFAVGLRQDEEVVTALPHPVPVPAQLPRVAGPFRGRASQLDQLERLRGNPDTTIIAISGGRGAGKTALATWWAHRIA
jgi:DNA-binding SARP family transcriptional activator